MPTLDGEDLVSIRSAAAELAAGGLVAFPTETVYGLGARADDDAAAAGIFRAKGRPADHPLIVHLAEPAQAADFTASWPLAAAALAARFWPGPMTLIVTRRPGVAAVAAGGLPTIGLRCPDHPVALALLREAAALGVAGVAGPSANRFGRVSPTCAAHVVDEFGPGLTVLDGGACREGIESTIIDCSREQPTLLRPGTLGRAAIEAVLRESAGLPLRERDAQAPRVSGSLASHYAPAARVRLGDARAIEAALGDAAVASTTRATVQPTPPNTNSSTNSSTTAPILRRHAAHAGIQPSVQSVTQPAATPRTAQPEVGVYSRRTPRPGFGCLHRVMPDDPARVAHELFAVLRDFDAAGVRTLWVETPPAGPDWDGVRDRLQRAAADRDVR
jgi:L-threonylcarbamoyladenylate synthase